MLITPHHNQYILITKYQATKYGSFRQCNNLIFIVASMISAPKPHAWRGKICPLYIVPSWPHACSFSTTCTTSALITSDSYGDCSERHYCSSCVKDWILDMYFEEIYLFT